MSSKIPKHKVVRRFEEARRLVDRGEWQLAEKVLDEVVAAGFEAPQLHAARGDVLAGKGEAASALTAYQEGLKKFPEDVELAGKVGVALAQLDRFREAIPYLERARPGRRKDPALLVHYGYTLIQAHRASEAEPLLRKAVALGGGARAKIVLAVARAKQGSYEEARALCAEVETKAADRELRAAARGIVADCLLFQGKGAEALAVWKDLAAAGDLDPLQEGHMALAAQLAGDARLCDELVAKRAAREPQPEDLLLFAQIANLRSRPEEALSWAARAEAKAKEAPPGFDFEVRATRGRAHRLLGRAREALAELAGLPGHPDHGASRLAAKVRVDLGHLALDRGDFDEATLHYRAALELDPTDGEALDALPRAQQRIAWKSEITRQAERQVAEARAEAEAVERRFREREGELERLRRELEVLRASKKKAEVALERAEDGARRAEEASPALVVRRELIEREAEMVTKAQEAVDRSMGEFQKACPPSVLNALLVAERTFQKALYTELPAAAVAVLYTGALERLLFVFFVERFQEWLQRGGRLGQFLEGAVRERRGSRVEYFDHFVEAFDEVNPGKAPSMGEIGRVLAKRREAYLEPFAMFLAETYGADDREYDGLAAFVLWAKEKLRDPVAHGRGEAVTYREVKKFRETLLFGLVRGGRGVVRALLSPR